MTSGGTTGRRVVLVAAVAANGVIGHQGGIPWRIPEDLKHFKATTTGHVVVMGRRTYESIGRPLPDRTTVVVTRDPDWASDGVLVASSVEHALELTAGLPGDVMVAGGSMVYEAATPYATHQVLTEVHASPEGDTYYPGYPDVDRGRWREVHREPHDGYDFVRWERTESAACWDRPRGDDARGRA